MPPALYVTSARAVVLRNGSVLVTEDEDGFDTSCRAAGWSPVRSPKPRCGGRWPRSPAGWSVGRRLIGFLQFYHLTTRLRGIEYP